MRLLNAIAIVALIGVATACGDRAAVPHPIVPTPASAPAPPRGVSSAVLVMSNVRAIETQLRPTEAYYYYTVKFQLTEATAQSGATITNIRMTAGSDTEDIGPSCWRVPIRVEAGASLDVFDAGWPAPLYCEPLLGSQLRLSSVSVVVSFVDDEGRAANVAATVSLTR